MDKNTGGTIDEKVGSAAEISVKGFEVVCSGLSVNEDGEAASLQDQQLELTNELRNIKREIQKRNGHRFDFVYKDPEPNFDRRRVKGMLGKFVTVKDKSFGVALNVCGGNGLYSIITDTQVTGELLLKSGQLQNRVTIIPLDKINSGILDPDTVKKAQQIVGCDNVWFPLSLIEYEDEVAAAVQFAFGYQLVCRDMNIAKQLAFDPQIQTVCVTLEGDFVNPEGSLSCSSRGNGCAILEMGVVKELEARYTQIEKELQQIRQHKQVAGTNGKISKKLN